MKQLEVFEVLHLKDQEVFEVLHLTVQEVFEVLQLTVQDLDKPLREVLVLQNLIHLLSHFLKR